MTEETKPLTTTPPQKDKKNNSNILWIAIIIIALAAAGYFAWNNSETQLEYRKLAEEKEMMRVELEEDLNSLMLEHEQIKTEYGQLSDSLQTKDSVILSNAQEIKELLNYKWEYRKVKKKLDRLRQVTKTYVNQMDSLYTVNNELVEENKEIKAKYHQEKKTNKSLNKEKAQLNEKIEEASIMKAYNMSSQAFHIKRNGKEKATEKARRTAAIEVCFTLSKNVVIEAGNQDVYVRIARPDNKILTPGIAEDYVFDYKGEKIQYSVFEQIIYDNEARPLCLRWIKKYDDIEMQEGVYEITVFANGEEIGSTSLELQ